MNQVQAFSSETSSDDGQTAYKRQLACAHLGIDPKDVQCFPFLRTELRWIARLVRGVDRNDPPSLTVIRVPPTMIVLLSASERQRGWF